MRFETLVRDLNLLAITKIIHLRLTADRSQRNNKQIQGIVGLIDPNQLDKH